MTDLRDTLLRQLEVAWALTQYHLNGLTTEECLWRPADRGLHVRLRDDGRWRADWPEHEGYELGPSSIGWITWHMIFWWSSAIDHAFGSATVTRESVDWPGSADAVRARLVELHAQWRRHVEASNDDELRSHVRTRWPFEGKPFSDVVGWLTVELAKSAAELGYARFLYAVRGARRSGAPPATQLEPFHAEALRFPEGQPNAVTFDRAAIEAVLERLDGLSESQLDTLPHGLIKLDVAGTILSYNQTEADLARLERSSVLGKNFFRDVAPCTRVQEFEGRFLAGVARKELNETFGFLFRFAHGARYVAITLYYSPKTAMVWVVISHATAA